MDIYDEDDLYDTSHMLYGIEWHHEDEELKGEYPTVEAVEKEQYENKARLEFEREESIKSIMNNLDDCCLVVYIRTNKQRRYEVARIPMEKDIDLRKQEEMIFDHYYRKLGKRFIHIKKPQHIAIRCSIVDELYIEYK